MGLREEAEQNARSGAALLDIERPGWEHLIDLDALDVSSCAYCVLAQLYGTFFAGISSLQLGMDRCIEYGFAVTAERNPRQKYALLTNAWRRLRDQRIQASCDSRKFIEAEEAVLVC